MQWDTVPGKPDSLGYLQYSDIWDNLGSHGCVADPNYTSVGELSAAKTLRIYPNPVISDYFTFEANSPVKSVQLFDIIGNEILKEVYNVPVKGNKVSIGSRNAGVYLIKVVFSDNRSSTKKVQIH